MQYMCKEGCMSVCELRCVHKVKWLLACILSGTGVCGKGALAVWDVYLARRVSSELQWGLIDRCMLKLIMR